jgi:uncharacterized membrane protein
MARLAAAALASIVLILATAEFARPDTLFVTIVVLLVWALWGQVELGRRNTRAAARTQALMEHVPGPLPDEAAEFLARVDSQLELPAGVRAEIRAELADHIDDSIAAIQAEGRDLDFATGEALARLGRPDELARQLRRAHRTTRRLLAGAAGGVWAAGAGAIQGSILAVWILLVAAVVIGIGLKPLIDFVATHVIPIQFDQNELGFGTAVGAAIAWVPAFVAGRRAVRACATISGRTRNELAPWWALAGMLGLGWLVVFVFTDQQSWLVVAFELAIPLAFAAGALTKFRARVPAVTGQRLRVGGGLLLIGTIVLASVYGLTGVARQTPTPGWGTSYTDDSIGWNHVAPHSPDQSINLDYWGYGVGDALKINVQDPATLSAFHDLRIEAWRAVAYPGAPSDVRLGLLDTGYSAPYATAPALVGPDGAIEDPISLNGSRTPRWWIFLTGTGADGRRYWLGSRPFFLERNFSGTIWDWLTAAA